MIGYPVTYGDNLSPKEASARRKKFFKVLTFGLGSFVSIVGNKRVVGFDLTSNQDYFLTKNTQVIEKIVDPIDIRGGNFEKTGPGARAKADSRRNSGKTGGTSIFVDALTNNHNLPNRNLNRHSLGAKPSKFENTLKFKNTAKNTNKKTLSARKRRLKATKNDLYIKEKNVSISFNQARKKMKRHFKDFDVKWEKAVKGAKLSKNQQQKRQELAKKATLEFMDKIKNLVLRGKEFESIYEAGKDGTITPVRIFLDKKTKQGAIFNATDNQFISGWRFDGKQLNDVEFNEKFGEY